MQCPRKENEVFSVQKKGSRGYPSNAPTVFEWQDEKVKVKVSQ